MGEHVERSKRTLWGVMDMLVTLVVVMVSVLYVYVNIIKLRA